MTNSSQICRIVIYLTIVVYTIHFCHADPVCYTLNDTIQSVAGESCYQNDTQICIYDNASYDLDICSIQVANVVDKIYYGSCQGHISRTLTNRTQDLYFNVSRSIIFNNITRGVDVVYRNVTQVQYVNIDRPVDRIVYLNATDNCTQSTPVIQIVYKSKTPVWAIAYMAIITLLFAGALIYLTLLLLAPI